MSFEEDEENELKIRESFQLLTQGVEMVHYEIENKTIKKYSKLKKILWLVSLFVYLMCFYILIMI